MGGTYRIKDILIKKIINLNILINLYTKFYS